MDMFVLGGKGEEDVLLFLTKSGFVGAKHGLMHELIVVRLVFQK
jgi:hypothetical protein